MLKRRFSGCWKGDSLNVGDNGDNGMITVIIREVL